MSSSARLGFEAYYVARMRLARFAAGGYRAKHELRRIARERQSTRIQARMHLAQAITSGKHHAFPSRFADLYRIIIHDNYRRLSDH